MKLGLTILILAAVLSPARAQHSGACPNQRAHPFPASDESIPPFRTCGHSVTLFGIEIRMHGPSCPSGRMLTPARAECLGEPQFGVRCLDLGLVPVSFSTCACVKHGGSLFSFWTCDCHAAGMCGFLPNAQTAQCP